MEVQATQILQNYKPDLKSEKLNTVEKVFNNLIQEDINNEKKSAKGPYSVKIGRDISEQELKKLSYEEVKELKSKLDEMNYFDKTNENGPDFLDYAGIGLLSVVDFTNDDNFNKTLFETMKNKDEPGLFLAEIKHNMEYSKGLKEYPFGASMEGDSNMTTNQIKNINVNEFLENAIVLYKKALSLLPPFLDRERTEQSLEDLKNLKENYEKRKKENNIILENITRNNKPNILQGLKNDK